MTRLFGCVVGLPPLLDLLLMVFIPDLFGAYGSDDDDSDEENEQQPTAPPAKKAKVVETKPAVSLLPSADDMFNDDSNAVADFLKTADSGEGDFLGDAAAEKRRKERAAQAQAQARGELHKANRSQLFA